MQRTLWTVHRRDVLGKVFFDVMKIELGGAWASKLFADYPWHWLIKAGIWSSMVIFVVLGFFTCPRRSKEEDV